MLVWGLGAGLPDMSHVGERERVILTKLIAMAQAMTAIANNTVPSEYGLRMHCVTEFQQYRRAAIRNFQAGAEFTLYHMPDAEAIERFIQRVDSLTTDN